MSERDGRSNPQAEGRRKGHLSLVPETAASTQERSILFGVVPARFELSEATHARMTVELREVLQEYKVDTIGREILVYSLDDSKDEQEFSAELLSTMMNHYMATEPETYGDVAAVEFHARSRGYPCIAFCGTSSPDKITALSSQVIARTNITFQARGLSDHIPESSQGII